MAVLVVIGALQGDTVTAWPLSAYKTSWMLARLLVVGAGIAALTACGATPSHPSTLLHISADNPLHRWDWTLRCEPAGGSAPSPRTLCRALEGDSRLLGARQFGDHSCPQGAPTLRIRGTYHGQRVDRGFTPCAFGADGVEARWLRLLGWRRRRPSS